MSQSIRYVALLRGINVGGHRMIKKDELQAIFDGCGFTDVRTVLASGNVVFSSALTEEVELQGRIEAALEEAVGYHVDVMIRTIDYLNELLDLNPFARAAEWEDVKLYVTFLTERPGREPELPVDLGDNNALALGMHDREFFAVSRKGRDGRYGDFGPFIRQAFGTQPVTTRNWRTIAKLAAM
jgi:uncharacterized protein (DUF1697 family)